MVILIIEHLKHKKNILMRRPLFAIASLNASSRNTATISKSLKGGFPTSLQHSNAPSPIAPQANSTHATARVWEGGGGGFRPTVRPYPVRRGPAVWRRSALAEGGGGTDCHRANMKQWEGPPRTSGLRPCCMAGTVNRNFGFGGRTRGILVRPTSSCES